METIFEMENNGFTGTKWKKKGGKVVAHTAPLTEGECFGYSTIWATEMLKGTPPKNTQGGILRAGLLQQKAEMQGDGWKSAVVKVVEDLGFKVGQILAPHWGDTARRLSGYKGFFLVDIGVHWVAMGRSGDALFFFDPNEGLKKYTAKQEFVQDVNHDLSWYNNDGWMTNQGKVCNCYEVRLG